MINLLVSILLWLLRFFSWIPGADTPVFVFSLNVAVAIVILAIIDKITKIFRIIIDNSKVGGFICLLFVLTLFSTASILLNLLAFVILVILVLRVRSREDKNFKKNFFREIKIFFMNTFYESEEEVDSEKPQKEEEKPSVKPVSVEPAQTQKEPVKTETAQKTSGRKYKIQRIR
ncbi:MAG: hypothetical protein WAV68_02050 [Candidatus Nanogingivalis sp.]